MEIEVYRALDVRDVPERVFWELDGQDDRYWASFANYEGGKFVIVAWATTGEVDGDIIAALIASRDHIITGYLDPLSALDSEFRVDDEDVRGIEDDDDEHAYNAPFEHAEPNAAGRRAALLARLRQVSNAPWLLVHDADEIEGWIEQGFRVVEPPMDVPADEAVLVLAWGELPANVYELLEERYLSWNLKAHRGFTREEPEEAKEA